jgi:hypothetical protein
VNRADRITQAKARLDECLARARAVALEVEEAAQELNDAMSPPPEEKGVGDRFAPGFAGDALRGGAPAVFVVPDCRFNTRFNWERVVREIRDEVRMRGRRLTEHRDLESRTTVFTVHPSAP